MAMAKPKKKRRWLRRLITWLVLLTVAAGAFALFVLPTWQAEATTTYVKYTASRGTISNALSFSGSVSVVNNETLTAGAAATVRTVYVAEGDQVESGDTLTVDCVNGELTVEAKTVLTGEVVDAD